MSDLFTTIIERDTYGSISHVVLGGLFLLSVFHLAMFFQNKKKSYLLYSCYTFFSLLAYMPVAESGFIATISQNLGFNYQSKIFFTIIFNCFYFFFFAEFLSIKKANPKWNQIIVYPVIILVSIAVFTFLLMNIFNISQPFNWFKTVFIYLISIHIIISFYILTKVRNNLKYYIIFGGLMLFFCSIIGEKAIHEIPWINLSKKMGDFVYFAGLLIENVAFSFALGHKQRINYREKVEFHEGFIAQLQKKNF